MYKWCFFLHGDENQKVVAEVKSDEDHKIVEDMVLEGEGVLKIPGPTTIYVNIAAVKCSLVEMVDETIAPSAT